MGSGGWLAVCQNLGRRKTRILEAKRFGKSQACKWSMWVGMKFEGLCITWLFLLGSYFHGKGTKENDLSSWGQPDCNWLLHFWHNRHISRVSLMTEMGSPAHGLPLTKLCELMSHFPACPIWAPDAGQSLQTNQPLCTPLHSKWGQWFILTGIDVCSRCGFAFPDEGAMAPHYLVVYRGLYSLKQEATKYCLRQGTHKWGWHWEHDQGCTCPTIYHITQKQAAHKGSGTAFWWCSWGASCEVVTCEDGLLHYRCIIHSKFTSIGCILHRWHTCAQEARDGNGSNPAYYHFKWPTWRHLYFVFLQL